MRSGSFLDSDCRGENRRSAEPVWLGVNCWWLVEWYSCDARSAHQVTRSFPYLASQSTNA